MLVIGSCQKASGLNVYEILRYAPSAPCEILELIVADMWLVHDQRAETYVVKE